MTFKEQQETLFTAIQLLMKLYQDISKRSEPFTLTQNSEVKKSFWIALRWSSPARARKHGNASSLFPVKQKEKTPTWGSRVKT